MADLAPPEQEEEEKEQLQNTPRAESPTAVIGSHNVARLLKDTDDDSNTEAEEITSYYHRASGAQTIFRHPRNDDDTINSTRSLYASEVVYIMIHGRRYCKDYFMPNDIKEQERLLMLNHVFLHVFDGRNTTVPLNDRMKILDVGCGTGEWAMAIAEEYPNSEVIGTDIAPIQSSAAPLNAFFELDDAEADGGWTYSDDDFDLVHFRYMKGAFLSWKDVYLQAYRVLKPGAYIEVVDFDDHKRIGRFFGPDSGVPRWLEALEKGTEKSGRSRGITHLEPECLTALGFVDVENHVYTIPIGLRPDDPKAQAIGIQFLSNILKGMEGICLRILTEQMGWSYSEIHAVLDEIGRATWEIATDAEAAGRIGFELEVKVTTGRKPG
ncbi:putative Demethylmenaquinone methyltransferase [Calycina marina]|uniref:Demethylmenaquinone methyltransferase n=1 Tax=Calycina marina TaxID=1763456 RepID=A0A9P8CI50_9HELO|nr:putative Demethylmenaquinone methyltransferase [Calycina marina]